MPVTKQPTSNIKPASHPMFVFEMPNDKKVESIMDKMSTSPSLADEAGLGASKAMTLPGEKKTRKQKKAVKNIKGMQYVMTTVAPVES